MDVLSGEELDFILNSLYSTKRKFEDYPVGNNGYPSYEFKQKCIKEVSDLIAKIKQIKKGN